MKENKEGFENEKPLKKKKKRDKDPVLVHDVLNDIISEKGARRRKDAIIEDFFINILKTYDMTGTTNSDSSLLEMYILKIELQYLLKVANKWKKRKGTAIYKAQ